MLVQWLLSIALASGITLGVFQGFFLLSKVHQAELALSREQSDIRFLVGYFRSILHGAMTGDQVCAEMIRREGALIPVISRADPFLAVNSCRQVRRDSVIVPLRFFLLESENKRGLTLFVQEGEHRREALCSGLQSLAVSYCLHSTTGIECRAAGAIQDWSQVRAVEFTLQFLANKVIDKLAYTPNHHRWQFTLKVGGSK